VRFSTQRPALAAVGGRVDAPSKRKKPKAKKTLKKRAAYPPSAARRVGRSVLIGQELTHMEHNLVAPMDKTKMVGTFQLNHLAKYHFRSEFLDIFPRVGD
jgi:hypothetical protein